jgi:hypothetical protein
MMRSVLCLAFLALMVVSIASGRSSAQAPELLSYQGVLMKSDGIALDGDGDLYELNFRLYPQQSGGSHVFDQTLNVAVQDGLYNVVLSNNQGYSLADVVAANPLLFMQVTILADPARGIPQDVVLEPRQQLASVPYALSAGEAGSGGGEDLAAHVAVDVKQDCVSGSWQPITNLTTGVTPPTSDYHVSSDVVVSVLNNGTSHYDVGIRLLENGVVVAGPTAGHTRQTQPVTLTLHYINTAPVAGAPLAYTVEYYSEHSSIDLQGLHNNFGQTESTLSVEMRHK